VVRQGHPLEDGPGHHDVEGAGQREERAKLLDRTLDEALVGRGAAPSLVQQARLRVDADDLTVGDEGGDDGREVARPAPQVEHDVRRPHRQRVQVELVVHAVVARVGRVPGAVPRRQPARRTQGAGAGLDLAGNDCLGAGCLIQ